MKTSDQIIIEELKHITLIQAQEIANILITSNFLFPFLEFFHHFNFIRQRTAARIEGNMVKDERISCSAIQECGISIFIKGNIP